MMNPFLRPAALTASLILALKASAAPYAETHALKNSPGGITYYVHPNQGSDSANGTTAATAWKTFEHVNNLKLAAGDRVLIAPGLHKYSLTPHAEGTEKNPVVIRFLRGVHEFSVEDALRRPWHISNSCDAPTTPKPMAVLVEESKHLNLEGTGASGNDRSLLLMGGRMIEFINSHSQNISWRNLAFDLKRPVVSEFRVEESAPGHSIIRIADGSTYSFQNGKFSWTGDLGSGATMVQQAIPAEGRCWRLGLDWNPFAFAEKVTDLGQDKFRLDFKDGYRLQTGHQFQFRHIVRDSVGGFNQRSKNISFRDCAFHALTNMGIVSQFTESLAFQNVTIAPPAGSLRTGSCWADALHFSGCKGRISVEGCRFSGLQDDAINVHGTHLRIIEQPSDKQLLVRFMHPQTYGFAAFAPGDEIAVISHKSLCELPNNPRRKVTAIEQKTSDGKDWLITLDGAAPNFGPNDVIDNLSWYPELIARNNRVDMASCRGFLITTRGKSLVEGNTFHRCAMPGILIEDDARGWFESGPIRDLTIRNNRFIGCGLKIEPQTQTPDAPVHENIRVLENDFDTSGIQASGVRELTIERNRFTTNISIDIKHCLDVRNENNKANASRGSAESGRE